MAVSDLSISDPEAARSSSSSTMAAPIRTPATKTAIPRTVSKPLVPVTSGRTTSASTRQTTVAPRLTPPPPIPAAATPVAPPLPLQVQLPQPPTPQQTKKMGFGKRFRNIFGRRGSRRKSSTGAEQQRLPVSSRSITAGSGSMDAISALTQPDTFPPCMGNTTTPAPQNYGTLPPPPPRSTTRHTQSHYADGPRSTYHQSTYTSSAYNFRQPVNSYAYTKEDEEAVYQDNQQIDHELEVSYFNG